MKAMMAVCVFLLAAGVAGVTAAGPAQPVDLAVSPAPGAAQPASTAPTSETLLTVTSPAGVRTYDRAALEALGVREMQTETPWTDGVKTFTGVPMLTVLKASGASGETVLATALNDFTASIPYAVLAERDTLLAWKMDGATLTPRDKGPLWIVYKRTPGERTDVKLNALSVWQLRALEVR